MKTHNLKSMVHPLAIEFEWAGIQFPKWVWSLPRGSKANRLAHAQKTVCGPCCHAPKPGSKGQGFYLGSCKWGVTVGDGGFSLRARWADEVEDSTIDHKGWYCDDFQSDTIRGLVFRLPRGRGFLAGWSMGANMCGSVGCDTYETEIEAARAANAEADAEAENEREANEKFQAEQELATNEATQYTEVFP